MKEITLKVYSVNEKLPEMFPAHEPEDWEDPENRFSHFCLVRDSSGNVAKAKYCRIEGRESWCKVDVLSCDESAITHWCQLPYSNEIGD